MTHHATPGDIATVEGPLAVLFAWVLSTHAFDVPSRRDVAYSLAGSTALIAVAAAQSVDLALGVWVLAWVACCVWGLVAMWQSRVGDGGRALAAAAWPPAAWWRVVAVLLVAVLPRPEGVDLAHLHRRRRPTSSPVDLPDRPDRRQRRPCRPTPPARRAGPASAGSSASPSPSTPADRVALGDEVVMRVRATRPNYWVGQTFDDWNGQSLGAVRRTRSTGSGPSGDRRLTVHHPDLPRPGGTPRPAAARTSRPSTWPRAAPTWSSTPTTPSGSTCGPAPSSSPPTAPSPRPPRWAPGTIYTVVSDDTAATPAQLRAATAPAAPPADEPVPGSRPVLGADRAGPLPAAPPRRPPGDRPGRRRSPGASARPATPTPTPTTRWRPSSSGWPPTSATRPTSRPLPGRHRRRGLVPLRQPPRLLRADLDGHGRDAPQPRHPGPRGRRATCPAPTTRSPTSTTSRPRTPTPGCRCGSPATAGRTSTRPPTVPLANPTPGSVLARSIGHGLGPTALDPHRRLVAGVTVAVVVAAPAPAPPAGRPGPTRWRPTWPAAVPASGCPRRPDETLTAYGERLGRGRSPTTRRTSPPSPSWSSGPPTAASSRRADQIAGALTRHPARSAPVPRRRTGVDGTGRTGPGRAPGPPVRTRRGPAPRRTRHRRPAAGGSPSAWPAG